MARKPGTLADLKVLVVDDENDICDMVRYALQGMGIVDVHVAPSGVDAWRLFYESKSRFDLVISDWMMPGMTGLDLLKRIRESGSDVPFIMLTVRTEKAAIAAAAKAGVTGYIGKPFDVVGLTKRVRAIANKILA